jgi:hypothetical protein
MANDMGFEEKCLFYLPKIDINRYNNFGHFFFYINGSSYKIISVVAVI